MGSVGLGRRKTAGTFYWINYFSTPCTSASCSGCSLNLGGRFELSCFDFFPHFYFFYFFFIFPLTKIHGYYVGGYLFFVFCFCFLMRLMNLPLGGYLIF